MNNNALFRKAALDKLASPERLDVLMAVTSPRGWLALLTIAGLLVAAVVWSIYGIVPKRVEGKGMLIKGGTLRPIVATSTGTLRTLTIARGAMIAEGDEIASVFQGRLTDNVAALRDQLNDTIGRQARADAEDRRQIEQSNEQIALLEADSEALRIRKKAKEQELAEREAQFDKREVLRVVVEAVRNELQQLEARLVANSGTITTYRGSITRLEQGIRERAGEVSRQQGRIGLEVRDQGRQTTIKSSVGGRVTELKKAIGDTVQLNEVIAYVEPDSETFEPVVFVTSSEGSNIQAGDEVQLVPSTVKREEHGYIEGTIASVDPFPISQGAMVALLPIESVVKDIYADGKSKRRVYVALRSAETFSGFKWSTGEGPQEKIPSGIEVSIAVIVERVPPYQLVMPFFRRWLGQA
jgi:HlyD family secretion protein